MGPLPSGDDFRRFGLGAPPARRKSLDSPRTKELDQWLPMLMVFSGDLERDQAWDRKDETRAAPKPSPEPESKKHDDAVQVQPSTDQQRLRNLPLKGG